MVISVYTTQKPKNNLLLSIVRKIVANLTLEERFCLLGRSEVISTCQKLQNPKKELVTCVVHI